MKETKPDPLRAAKKPKLVPAFSAEEFLEKVQTPRDLQTSRTLRPNSSTQTPQGPQRTLNPLKSFGVEGFQRT